MFFLPSSPAPQLKKFPMNKLVLVCQNRTCRKQGAAAVLAKFQDYAGADFRVEGTGCLGQCGNGPMVLVEPDEVWYCRLNPKEVPVVVEQHLQGGMPVKAMLYPKFHTGSIN
jgi:(2Fe-2S) ferredoxin